MNNTSIKVSIVSGDIYDTSKKFIIISVCKCLFENKNTEFKASRHISVKG